MTGANRSVRLRMTAAGALADEDDAPGMLVAW